VRFATLGLALATILAATPVRAETPDAGLAILAGSATALAGFAAGGLLLGTSGDRNQTNNLGWMTIQGGFVLAPLSAHAVVGEWGRGALFAAAPAAMWAGSMSLVQYAPNVVAHGTLEEQRVLWGLFGVAFFSSAVGVVDAVFAPRRATPSAPGEVRVAPTAVAGGAELAVQGTL
jgi:hypothetical protein